VPAGTPKNQVIEKLKLAPDIFAIVNYYGNFVVTVFTYDTPSSLRRKNELIQKLSNAYNFTFGEIPWPEVNIRFSKTDWQIISSLHHNPRKSQVAISKELGISTRTVERRLHRMTKANAVFALSSLKVEALEGTVLGDLMVSYSPSNRAKILGRMLSKLEEYVWHLLPPITSADGNVEYTFFEMAIPNISQAGEILDWAKRQPDVLSTRIDLKQNHIILRDALDEQLERRYGGD
jgi:DNA-binding Lrp family transcriptional regulator